MPELTPFRIGFLINPVAGMGGSVGLKGTDGEAIVAEAIRRGARPQASERAIVAINQFLHLKDQVRLMTASGAMGEDLLMSAGFKPDIIYVCRDLPNADDTSEASRCFKEARADLILFAGGDGTARNIFDVAGLDIPVLGIPAGVKMHSGVFATSPAAAGRLAALVVQQGTGFSTQETEILDIDEDAARLDRVSPRLYGYARVPFEKRLLQQPKARALPGDEMAIRQAAHAIAAEMERNICYVTGPGQATKHVLSALGLNGTLLGVDLVKNGGLVGRDLTGDQLRELTKSEPLRIIAGITGGQGFLFGRGNQQIGATIIHKASRDGLIIIAGPQKLANLPQARLLVDTGDPLVDKAISGYVRVRCGPSDWAVMKIEPA